MLWCGLGQREEPNFPLWEAGTQTSPAGYSAKTKQGQWEKKEKEKKTHKKNKPHFLISVDQTGARVGGRASVQARGVFSTVITDSLGLQLHLIFFFPQGFLYPKLLYILAAFDLPCRGNPRTLRALPSSLFFRQKEFLMERPVGRRGLLGGTAVLSKAPAGTKQGPDERARRGQGHSQAGGDLLGSRCSRSQPCPPKFPCMKNTAHLPSALGEMFSLLSARGAIPPCHLLVKP